MHNHRQTVLEEVSRIDVEGAIAILLAVLANGLSVLEANDEVLVHDKAETGTHSNVRAIPVRTLRHISIILTFHLLVFGSRLKIGLCTAKRHVVTLGHHCTVAEQV